MNFKATTRFRSSLTTCKALSSLFGLTRFLSSKLTLTCDILVDSLSDGPSFRVHSVTELVESMLQEGNLRNGGGSFSFLPQADGVYVTFSS